MDHLVRASLSRDGQEIEQVLQLNSCREHWIQAEISLHAWFKNEVDIWTDLPLSEGRKADLYSHVYSGDADTQFQ